MAHAFEPDHLLAVVNLVSRRDTTAEAVRDGVAWALGHTTTLAVVGLIVLWSRTSFLRSSAFEPLVGAVLIVMGVVRLIELRRPLGRASGRATHGWAYTVGLLHGLAGSGLLVLLVASDVGSVWIGLLYFLMFGIGSAFGIFVVTALCSIPFTRRMTISRRMKAVAVTLSSLACVGYGGWMIAHHLPR